MQCDSASHYKVKMYYVKTFQC